MSERVWSSNALGNDGVLYFVMGYTLSVLPLAIIALLWYMLSGGIPPAPVIAFIVVASLVILHQELEVLRFFRVASLTVKKVVVKNDSVTMQLFSNKWLRPSDCHISRGVSRTLEKTQYSKLFPEDRRGATLSCDEGTYYLTGTIDEFEVVYDHLVALSSNKARSGLRDMASEP